MNVNMKKYVIIAIKDFNIALNVVVNMEINLIVILIIYGIKNVMKNILIHKMIHKILSIFDKLKYRFKLYYKKNNSIL